VGILALGKTGSAGTRKMLAAIVALTIVLVALVTILMIEPARLVRVDRIETAAVHDPSRMATYSFSLAEFVRERCGDTPTEMLAAASAEEKAADPEGYAEAVVEAEARASTITSGKSCDYVISEILAAERPTAAAGSKPAH
jgi:hypothetical protein